jgi:hypothetical protein
LTAPLTSLTFESDHDVLRYEDDDGQAFHARVDPLRLIQHLERAAPTATMVMAGTPLQAAVKLLLVHIDEDLHTGRNPFRHFL